MSPADTFPDPGTKVGQPRDSQSAVRTNTMPLWTQLLQRNTPALGLAPGGGGNVKSLPPIAPVDKAGTSMRILLHDTQAQFEKFSERVVKLTDGVEGAKREVTTMQKLFEREHEHLMEEVVDLANRCQTQIQKSIGHPAQVSRLDEVHQKLDGMDKRLSALDSKVDMLHMLNQTQSQALQTLQDQQGQLLSALIPVLPLLQTVPLHIENARNDLKEAVSRCQKASSEEIRSMLTLTTNRLQRSFGTSSSIDSELPPSSSPASQQPLSSPSDRRSRKRRRSESRALITRRDIYPSPRASASESQLAFTPKSVTSPRSSSALNPRIEAPSSSDPHLGKEKGPKNIPVADSTRLTGPDTSVLLTPIRKTCRSPIMSPNRPIAPSNFNNAATPTASAGLMAAQVPSVPVVYQMSPDPKLLPVPSHVAEASLCMHNGNTPLEAENAVLPSRLKTYVQPRLGKPVSLKDMPAAMNGSKRFIPIDDDDDDEDGDNDIEMSLKDAAGAS